ncbi:MAG: N-acetylmuramoyl-L-alanine amidase-like domain-containing protein [Bacteroidales bacterium]
MKITIILLALPFISCAKPNDNRPHSNIEQQNSEKITVTNNTDSLIFYNTILPILTKTRNENSDICNILDQFLGTPYVAGTLENDTERLTVNFRELDCFTYWETAAALYIQASKNKYKLDFDTYKHILSSLRYENDKPEGYSSRNHYTSEWIKSNADKGLIQELTKSVGGIPLHKEINFMSENKDKYPALAHNNKELQRIKEKEETLKGLQIYYIPKKDVGKLSKQQIHNGDMLAVVTSIKGLDVTHVGFARWVDNALHFQHASSKNMKVEITENPLSNYLEQTKHFIGIRVLRINL